MIEATAMITANSESLEMPALLVVSPNYMKLAKSNYSVMPMTPTPQCKWQCWGIDWGLSYFKSLKRKQRWCWTHWGLLSTLTSSPIQWFPLPPLAQHHTAFQDEEGVWSKSFGGGYGLSRGCKEAWKQEEHSGQSSSWAALKQSQPAGGSGV